MPGSTFTDITQAHNAWTKEEVDHVLKCAEVAAAHIERPAQNTEGDGYGGYLSDPDEYLWEVAWGVFEFNEDGSLIVTRVR